MTADNCQFKRKVKVGKISKKRKVAKSPTMVGHNFASKRETSDKYKITEVCVIEYERLHNAVHERGRN